ncbi:hydrogenase 4 subunit F [Psychromonas sp. CD1]|uniref:hydrogenase 4 subunit F n=1 Tax=Psychromonas sp. CD1 TaxID=1979839 RepID=UPI000B9B9599|nr:hydrogenase 4 subunit F [Psychromonas sp. CD1]
MSLSMLLPLVVALPLVAAIVGLLSCFIKKSGYKIAIAVHVISMLSVLILTLSIALTVFDNGAFLMADKWIYIDSLSALFLAVLGVVAFFTGWHSLGYIEHEYQKGEMSARKVSLYYGLFNLFLTTMIVALMSNNVIMMWVMIEATTVTSVFLVGIYGQRSSLEAAWKYIIICSVGVSFGLFGSILTYSNAAATLAHPENAIFWTYIRDNASLLDPTLVHLAFIFVIIGFGTKTGLFPMHAWLPDAHSEAPSPVSALLSAGLLNCAFLVILRYYIITYKAIGINYPQMLLLVFGFLSVFFAAFFILAQRDIKRMLAYSSVENMGLITLGIALGPIGVFAALLHVINHSLGKTLMFCGSGNLLLKYGSRDMGVIKGVLRVTPVTGVVVAVGAFALGGVPPFNLFLSEFMIIAGGVASDHLGLMIALALLLTVVLAGLARFVAMCILGKKPENMPKGEVSKMMVVPLVVLLGLMLLMGTHIPNVVLRGVDQAALIVLDSDRATVLDVVNLPWQQITAQDENEQVLSVKNIKVTVPTLVVTAPINLKN